MLGWDVCLRLAKERKCKREPNLLILGHFGGTLTVTQIYKFSHKGQSGQCIVVKKCGKEKHLKPLKRLFCPVSVWCFVL